MDTFRDNPEAYLPAGVDILGAEIRFYAIIILIGIIIGAILCRKEAERLGISKEIMLGGILPGVVVGILGARIYYVVFEWQYYSQNFIEIFAIWNGGLAIHGGIITAIIFVCFYSKRANVSCLKLLDIIAIGLLVGQICGRWGNFFNQEAHGGATTYEFLSNTLHLPNFIVQQMYIDGIYYHPTFLYESLWNLIALVLLLVLRRKKVLRLGDIFPIYMIWYSIGRFCIELMRTDALMVGDVRVNIVMSVVFVIVGIIFLIIKYTKYDFDYYINYLDIKEDVVEKEDIEKTEKQRMLIRRKKAR